MKRRHIISLALVAMITPSMAWAHGPTRQKVTETVEIDAPPADVWAYVGNFQDMSWHPAVASTEGEGGNDIDATRVLTLNGPDGTPSDAQLNEILYKYSDEKMSYSYRLEKDDIEVLPVTNYSSHVTVKPRDDGGSTLEWRGAFYRGFPNNDPPEELSDEAAIEAVTGVYRAGLDAVAEHFSQ